MLVTVSRFGEPDMMDPVTAIGAGSDVDLFMLALANQDAARHVVVGTELVAAFALRRVATTAAIATIATVAAAIDWLVPSSLV